MFQLLLLCRKLYQKLRDLKTTNLFDSQICEFEVMEDFHVGKARVWDWSCDRSQLLAAALVTRKAEGLDLQDHELAWLAIDARCQVGDTTGVWTYRSPQASQTLHCSWFSQSEFPRGKIESFLSFSALASEVMQHHFCFIVLVTKETLSLAQIQREWT